jgi:hypothetical protein
LNFRNLSYHSNFFTLQDDTTVERGKKRDDKKDEGAEKEDKDKDAQSGTDYLVKKFTKGGEFYENFQSQVQFSIIEIHSPIVFLD